MALVTDIRLQFVLVLAYFPYIPLDLVLKVDMILYIVYTTCWSTPTWTWIVWTCDLGFTCTAILTNVIQLIWNKTPRTELRIDFSSVNLLIYSYKAIDTYETLKAQTLCGLIKGWGYNVLTTWEHNGKAVKKILQ